MGKKERIIVLAVGLALLIIFTFHRLTDFHSPVYKKSFRKEFRDYRRASFQYSFHYSAVAFCCVCAIKRTWYLGSPLRPLRCCPLLFAFMGGFMTWNYINKNVGQTLPVFVPVIIGLVLLVLALLLVRCVPEKYAHRAVTYAVTAIFYFIAVIVIMNLLKSFMGRMRMREMTEPDGIYPLVCGQ